MSTIKAIGICLLIVAMISLPIYYVSSIWSECREFGHSWFYCLRMIQR